MIVDNIFDILQSCFEPLFLYAIGQYGHLTKVSYFIPDPRNFYEMTILSDGIKKYWLKATLKDIKNIINNHNFLVQDPEKGEPVNLCMDVYKAKNQSDGSLDKLKLIIVVRGDLHKKELVGDTCVFTYL